MSIDFSNSKGKIDVSDNAISTIVGATVLEVYGVIGMSSQRKIKDNVAEILKMDNYSKGIIINTKDNEICISIHIIVLYGVKISEVARNIQDQVKFALEKMLGLSVSAVNIVVEDVRIDKSVK